MRMRLGGKKQNRSEDFLVWWCCGPCATFQEASHVDAIHEVRVKCCCTLVSFVESEKVPLSMVGKPVAIAGDAPVEANLEKAVDDAQVMDQAPLPPPVEPLAPASESMEALLGRQTESFAAPTYENLSGSAMPPTPPTDPRTIRDPILRDFS